MKKETHKQLTAKDVKAIIKLIEKWDHNGPKLTWPNLVEACKDRLGISRTRQSLMKVSEINAAFKAHKAALKVETQTIASNWIKDLKEANERVAKQAEDIRRLKVANEMLLERFTVWQYNAKRAGLTEAQLEGRKPLFR